MAWELAKVVMLGGIEVLLVYWGVMGWVVCSREYYEARQIARNQLSSGQYLSGNSIIEHLPDWLGSLILVTVADWVAVIALGWWILARS